MPLGHLGHQCKAVNTREKGGMCVCVCEKDMLDVVYTVYAIYTVDK